MGNSLQTMGFFRGGFMIPWNSPWETARKKAIDTTQLSLQLQPEVELQIATLGFKEVETELHQAGRQILLLGQDAKRWFNARSMGEKAPNRWDMDWKKHGEHMSKLAIWQ